MDATAWGIGQATCLLAFLASFRTNTAPHQQDQLYASMDEPKSLYISGQSRVGIRYVHFKQVMYTANHMSAKCGQYKRNSLWWNLIIWV